MGDPISHRKLEHITAAVTHLLNAPGVPDTTDCEGNSRIESLLKNLNFGESSNYHVYRAQANNAWINMKVPLYTVAAARTIYQEYIRNLKRSDPSNLPLRMPEADEIVMPLGTADHYRSCRLVPETGTHDLENPCEYVPEVKYEVFEHLVVYDHLAKCYDVNSTLLGVLKEAQKYGFTRQQMADWLKFLVKKVMPERANYVREIEDPNDVWKFVLGSINYPQYIKRLVDSLTHMVRGVDESFSGVMQRYVGTKDKLDGIARPNIDRAERRKQAENDAKKVMKNFVIPLVNTKLTNHGIEFQREFRRMLTFQERIDYVEQLECQEGLKPKEPLAVSKANAQLSVYLSRVEVGDSECFANTSRTTGVTSADLGPGDRWKARSDLSQSSYGDQPTLSDNDHSNEGHVSRRDDFAASAARRAQRKSKIYLRTKSGNRTEAHSISRVERTPTPNGRRRRPLMSASRSRSRTPGNRPNSGSHSRGQKSPRRVLCALCLGSDCSGVSCNVYGWAEPTPGPCSSCNRGHHAAAMCATRRPQRPASQGRAKSPVRNLGTGRPVQPQAHPLIPKV